jgi:pteridine reductase
MFELAGRTALVTGAAKRIGNAISHGLAKEGVNVIIHYSRSESEAKRLQGELVALGVESWTIKTDLDGAKACEDLVEEACRSAGEIEILVNNASVFSLNNATNVKLKDIEFDMLINAWTPFLLTRFFSEKTHNGKIINLLDTRIAGYDFNHFSYYLSKKMLEVFTKSMALELAPNATVNGIAPGLILPPEGKDLNYLEERKNAVPMKKYGSVSNIVETVLFLLRNDFVTGQIIYVDGGKHLIQSFEGL